MRQSMLALIDKVKPQEAHPRLLGEGGAGR
jgi:hypothetical protein